MNSFRLLRIVKSITTVWIVIHCIDSQIYAYDDFVLITFLFNCCQTLGIEHAFTSFIWLCGPITGLVVRSPFTFYSMCTYENVCICIYVTCASSQCMWNWLIRACVRQCLCVVCDSGLKGIKRIWSVVDYTDWTFT